ncbi:hypothetical protein [Streptomyces sp. AB3(2024)]|uniref:hypothetical protein n=1 Tax=Streptomyces sp. AB3(2024) TaxID=3317321 RepID=UPI0035A262D8
MGGSDGTGGLATQGGELQVTGELQRTRPSVCPPILPTSPRHWPPPTGWTRLRRSARPRRAGCCGLPGFTLPAVLRETVRDAGATWSCGTATAEGAKQAYATFSATQDPVVISGIRKSKGFTAQGFDATHTVTECSGKPTYFAMEPGPRYTESLGVGAPAPRDLFASFTKAAEGKFGCIKP